MKKKPAQGYLLSLPGINLKITHNKTIKKMKKLLFVLALGAFAACGSGENKEVKADSTTTVDTTKVSVDTSKAAVDTAAKVDTTKAKK